MNVLSQWKTRDLIVTAVISVAIGLVFFGYDQFYTAMTGILGQVGLMLILGFYYISGILVPYIVRKPGAALLASFLAAFTELLLGSQFGILGVWAGIIQGLGAEAVFASRGWKDYRLPVLMIAAIFSGIFAFVYEYFLFSYGQLALAVQAGLFLLRIPSAAILAGWLGKVIGDALVRTGALRGMAITKHTT
jgi:energy-coupling factor transport system substrate-specific component